MGDLKNLAVRSRRSIAELMNDLTISIGDGARLPLEVVQPALARPRSIAISLIP
jgi:hypothetical protein